MQSNEIYNQPPKDGIYIKDLILEGASWDYDKNKLKEPEQMTLTQILPNVHFKMVEKSLKAAGAKHSNFYNCPCYIYQNREGLITQQSYFFTMQLPLF